MTEGQRYGSDGHPTAAKPEFVAPLDAEPLRVKALCLACAYFRAMSPLLGEDTGECRRYPPQATSPKEGLVDSNFPHVRVEWWCGEFKTEDEVAS